MARFTRYNNPSRKRTRRHADWNGRQATAARASLTDRKLGYEIPTSFYTGEADTPSAEAQTPSEDLSAMVTITETYYFCEPESATMSKADLIDLLPELYADEEPEVITALVTIVKGLWHGDVIDFKGYRIEA